MAASRSDGNVGGIRLASAVRRQTRRAIEDSILPIHDSRTQVPYSNQAHVRKTRKADFAEADIDQWRCAGELLCDFPSEPSQASLERHPVPFDLVRPDV